MTLEDKKWIISHLTSGWDDINGVKTPWVAVPNRDDRQWTYEEIMEALKYKKEMVRDKS